MVGLVEAPAVLAVLLGIPVAGLLAGEQCRTGVALVGGTGSIAPELEPPQADRLSSAKSHERFACTQKPYSQLSIERKE